MLERFRAGALASRVTSSLITGPSRACRCTIANLAASSATCARNCFIESSAFCSAIWILFSHSAFASSVVCCAAVTMASTGFLARTGEPCLLDESNSLRFGDRLFCLSARSLVLFFLCLVGLTFLGPRGRVGLRALLAAVVLAKFFPSTVLRAFNCVCLSTSAAASSAATSAAASAAAASAASTSLWSFSPVSYTHLRAHETPEHLVCRLLLEKKKKQK
eukprot:TRINITY_DN50068_c0_g1_i1.p1 TRINITY_DN50068_c0_g1~~TRINITY_DN50068_c0_g1_i1.p1  ORF type:complete len:219 (-),score=46.66 TRINITY_DN50068_c0_g1_i1:21-677(-)